MQTLGGRGRNGGTKGLVPCLVSIKGREEENWMSLIQAAEC